ANSALLPGGGVDGAIRRKAGNALNEDLYRIGRCPTGQAVITPGYRLRARHVIHTVAPVYESRARDQRGAAERSPPPASAQRECGRECQESLLASCYDSVLALADQYQIKSIAFPAIGTGAYGWPSDVAAKIALGCVTNHLANCA